MVIHAIMVLSIGYLMDQIAHQIFNAVQYHVVDMLIVLLIGNHKDIQSVELLMLLMDSMLQTNLGL